MPEQSHRLTGEPAPAPGHEPGGVGDLTASVWACAQQAAHILARKPGKP